MHEYRTHFGADVSRGLIATISHEFHTAIDQVWGGMFQYGVKVERERERERERQRTALEAYRKQQKLLDAP